MTHANGLSLATLPGYWSRPGVTTQSLVVPFSNWPRSFSEKSGGDRRSDARDRQDQASIARWLVCSSSRLSHRTQKVLDAVANFPELLIEQLHMRK